jgi:hypothetical protein
MTQETKSPIAKDKLQAAVKALSELVLKYPEKKRGELLQLIQLQYDLSPLDCEFLNRHFYGKQCGE